MRVTFGIREANFRYWQVREYHDGLVHRIVADWIEFEEDAQDLCDWLAERLGGVMLWRP